MYKQFLKSILLVTLATFSLSTLVSAKPIPKNATPDQIMQGMQSGTYTNDDFNRAFDKYQPNVLGFSAFAAAMEGGFDAAYSVAREAARKNDALGKLTEGYLYATGKKAKAGLDEKKNIEIGSKMIAEACSNKSLKKSSIPKVVEICSTFGEFGKRFTK